MKINLKWRQYQLQRIVSCFEIKCTTSLETTHINILFRSDLKLQKYQNYYQYWISSEQTGSIAFQTYTRVPITFGNSSLDTGFFGNLIIPPIYPMWLNFILRLAVLLSSCIYSYLSKLHCTSWTQLKPRLFPRFEAAKVAGTGNTGTCT